MNISLKKIYLLKKNLDIKYFLEKSIGFLLQDF